jgi:hypothetical protein
MFKHFNVLNKSLSERFISQIQIACVTDNHNIKVLIVDREDYRIEWNISLFTN